MKLTNLFSRANGLTVWNIVAGYGAIIRMNFGTPYLDIDTSIDGKTRSLIVGGDFYLRLDYADWIISHHDEIIKGADENIDGIDKLLRKINGQILTSVEEEGFNITLNFDLGGQIQILNYTRFDDLPTLWTFCTYSELVEAW